MRACGASCGKGPADIAGRVLRGGSWNNDNPDNFRCANRNNNNPANRNDNNGFRCARTLEAGARQSTDGRGVLQRVQAGSWSGRHGRPGRIQKGSREAGSALGREGPPAPDSQP